MKKILKATFIGYLVYKVLDYIIHGLLLAKGYEDFATSYRADMMDYMWVFFVGPFIVLFLVAKLSTLIKDQGRCFFPMIMPLIIMIPAAFYTWASIDISIKFTLIWFILGLIQVFITTKIIMKFTGTNTCSCKHCK